MEENNESRNVTHPTSSMPGNTPGNVFCEMSFTPGKLVTVKCYVMDLPFPSSMLAV